jgi:hypothetical protein
VSGGSRHSFEAWRFAAEYSFLELEAYCPSDNFVYVILRDILLRPYGLELFLNNRIPAAIMSRVVADVIARPPVSGSKDSECIAYRYYDGKYLSKKVCSKCREYCFACLQGLNGERLSPWRDTEDSPRLAEQ